MRGEAPPDLTPEDLERRRALTAQIEAYVRPYLARNPRVKRAVDALLRPGTSETEEIPPLKKAEETSETFETFVGWDHLAFRSFDRVDGGLLAVARVFEKHGYTCEGSLTFEAKKVDARWFAPPAARWARDARGDPAFPRLFVSHLRVDDLPDDARKVIERRVGTCEESGRNAARVAERGGVPWSADGADASADVIKNTIALDEYETLSNASEYAAWTLVHGHALNHVAVAVHRLFEHHSSVSVSSRDDDSPPPRRRFASLEACLAFLKAPPLSTKTSRAGGCEVKVSPDGGLRQAATVADVLEFGFISSNTLEGDSRGVPGEASARTTRKMLVPASYVEFVDRLPIAGDAGDETNCSYAGDGGAYVPERSRRDGFETANADAIFESTFRAQQRDG